MSVRPALDGVKVVEFAHVIAGPLAGALMADLGADVVHVEDPTHGDPGRRQRAHEGRRVPVVEGRAPATSDQSPST